MFLNIDVLVAIITLTRLVPLSHAAPQVQNDRPAVTPATSTDNAPIAAAWVYLSDDYEDYNTVPTKWSTVDFSTVDTLMITPVGIQPDGTFGLYKSASRGDLATRFRWTITQARKQNPKIKLIAAQFWGNSPGTWGNSLNTLKGDAAVEKYAASVAEFMKAWPDLDGWDVDYESTNVVANFPAIAAAVRAKLDTLSGGKTYQTSVSPASAKYLKGTAGKLSYVNMQNYMGGSELTVESFTGIGFREGQLLYGYNAEQPGKGDDIEVIKQTYRQKGLAGIHVWRLNSSDQKAEGKRMKDIYEYLHPGALKRRWRRARAGM